MNKNSIAHWLRKYMGKVTVYELFFIFAIVLNLGERNIYTSIILMCASALEIIDVLPKIILAVKDIKHDCR